MLALTRRERVIRLFTIWMGAFGLVFLTTALAYTLFLGRNQVVLNQTIYEDHRYVGAPGTIQLATQEGYGITTHGENGLVVDKTLRNDAVRVVFLGDSFVKAKHVSDADKFTEIVEQRWNAAHPERPIQTLNLGLAGQDMTTYLSFGRNVDQHFRPEIVFLMVSPADFQKIAERPNLQEAIVGGLHAPITHPERYSMAHDLMNALGLRSFAGQLQAQTYAFLRKGKETAIIEAAPLPQAADFARELDLQLTALKQIWGDRLVIIYRKHVPNLGQGEPATLDEPLLHALTRTDTSYINLYPVFWQAMQDHAPPLGFHNSILGEGHFNRHGHTLVAEEVLRFLESAHDLF